MPESVKPPQMAALLLSIFASEPIFPQIEGDLSEEFHQRTRMNGLNSARHWYWRETFRNVLVFIKRPKILQVLAVAALCSVVGRFTTFGPVGHRLLAKLNELPGVLGLGALKFLFWMCVTLILGVLAGRMLRGRERILISAFTVFSLLFHYNVPFILWQDRMPLPYRIWIFLGYLCTFIAFWIATRWSARLNRQRSIT
jgi:hypothetical protein